MGDKGFPRPDNLGELMAEARQGEFMLSELRRIIAIARKVESGICKGGR